MNHLIIDGHALAYRSHYAFSTLTAPSAVPGQVVYSGCAWGFLTGLRLRKKKHPDCRITVTWDNEAVRKKVAFPEYKAERSRIGIHEQIADLKEMLGCINVTQAECLGEEADDVIATLVRKYSEEGLVYILTSDKDLMQLVRDGKVIMIRPKTSNKPESFYDEDAVRAEYGVPTKGIASFLALRGDQVDGIPGLQRVRSTVIADLVTRYGEPGAIYSKIASEKLTDFERASFDSFRQQAEVNYTLTKLVDDLDLRIRQGSDNPERLKSFLDKYGIKKIESESYVDAFGKENLFSSRTSVAMALPSLFD